MHSSTNLPVLITTVNNHNFTCRISSFVSQIWVVSCMTIFTVLLRAHNVCMYMQGRNILLFVDSCATHPKDMLCIRNMKVVYYPTNCTSMLQPLDLGTMRCIRELYRMHVVQAGLVIHQGYVHEKRHANWTQYSHLKQCISWGLGDWQSHPA